MRLVRLTHCFLDVEARVDFLAGVEDVVRVKNMLSLFKELKHGLTEHLIEVGGTDDAVVVLTADVAFVFNGGTEKLFGHLFDECGGGFVGEIEEGIEVEVPIATMAMHRRGDIEFFEETLNFHKEL